MTQEQMVAAAYLWFTVKQLCKRHEAFTEGGIRHLIFHENENGLKESGAIVRMGRRILIHEPKFFAWLEDGQRGRK